VLPEGAYRPSPKALMLLLLNMHAALSLSPNTRWR
jgi:hypothetical protein